MNTAAAAARLRKFEFESRIFISFGIVGATCAVSFTVFAGIGATAERLGSLAGLPVRTAASLGFLLSALMAAAASALRIWSGSALTSRRMMSFRVRVDTLLEEGPYRIVRNPIYLADLIAFTGFALCLPPCGAALPVLLFLHYSQIIRYEEVSLARQFGGLYAAYEARVPRLLPDRQSLRRLRRAVGEFSVNRDGLRHNALYLLFIPGFLLSAATGKLLWAVAVGLPAVVDWAVVHTKIGTAGESSPSAPKDRERADGRLQAAAGFQERPVCPVLGGPRDRPEGL